MNSIDYAVIGIYLALLLAMGIYFSRRQKSQADYFVGGRALPWWAIGISTMATQLSAISFISAPAFVAVKAGGGLRWLGYEFAVPAALVILILVFLPVFHEMRGISIYQFLEERFDRTTRRLISAIFLISRGLATGVAMYASAIVLSVVLPLELWQTILLTGAATIAYDYMGGIKAVVYSDVIQMGILVGGLALCGAVAWSAAGGWESALAAVDPARLQTIDWKGWGLTQETQFGFWPLFVGGLFLYLSYYGCDQSQMQRELSAGSLSGSRRSLLFNAFGRFPVVLGYCLVGLLLVGVLARDPDLGRRVAETRPDFLVPYFILGYLPHGLMGLLVVGILAAAMSSLDSALNSLSAATVSDFIEPALGERAEGRLLLYSKLTTVFWGIFCTAFAFAAGRISDTVIVGINKIGSLFYGPVLAAFLLGIFSRRGSGRSLCLGLVAGVLFNGALWIFAPWISWLWWNVTGCIITFFVGSLSGQTLTRTSGVWRSTVTGKWIAWAVACFLFILVMILVASWLSTLK